MAASRTYNRAEFGRAAREFALRLAPRADAATVIGLYGELGAGKTAFVQAAARALGVSERVTSPTFLIFRKFPLPAARSRYKFLVHADCYRLGGSDELRALRFDELLSNPANLIFVEWAARAGGLLPRDHFKISIEFVSRDVRTVVFS